MKYRTIKTGIIVSAIMIAIPCAVSATSPNLSMDSKGRFEYDENKDNNPETVLDAGDLSRLSSQSEVLSENISSLEEKYNTLQSSFSSAQNQLEKFQTIGDATPADILVGKTAWVDGQLVTGTINKISSAPVSTYTADSNTPSTEKDGNVSVGNADTVNLGINQKITMPAGYYNENTIINNQVKDKGSVKVSFTKAIQSVTLDSGYYDGLSFDTTDLYMAGYKDGKEQNAQTQTTYDKITICPGEYGLFTSDSSSAEKTFTGPSYDGITTDITPKEGYYSTGWTTDMADGAIKLTQTYAKKQEASTETINLTSGSYYTDKTDAKTIEIAATGIMSHRSIGNKNAYAVENINISGKYEIWQGNVLLDTITLLNTDRTYPADAQCIDSNNNINVLYTWYGTVSDTKSVSYKSPVSGITVKCISFSSNCPDAKAIVTIGGYKHA